MLRRWPGALRACLALKLWSIERKSHVMALVADEGLALFAGLNAFPKKSYLSEYSSRIDHRKTTRFLAAWHEQVHGTDLLAGESFNYAGCFSDLGLFWRFSLPAVLTGLLNGVVSWGASALVVNQVGGYGDMGIYNAALRVKMLPETFLGMLIAPMLPILSEAFGKGDRATFQRTLLFNFLLATLIIVPVSLVQAAAPALTLLPFGAGYQGHPGIVVWLMLHAVMTALMFPMGSVLISMGEMWFSWLVNLLFGLVFGVAACVLVPRYGASGYAASMVIGYSFACVPCVVFLYRKLPYVMRFLRWGLIVLVTGVLFILCVVASTQLPFAWAIVVGLAAAMSFLFLKYRLHAGAAFKVVK